MNFDYEKMRSSFKEISKYIPRNINRVIKNNCALIAASEKIKINIPLIAVKTLSTRILIKLITTIF